MQPSCHEEEEARREGFKKLLRLSDIEFDERSMTIVWADANPGDLEGHIEVNFTSGMLTFEALEDLSMLFGTRDIDIGWEHGTGSDLCHERVIILRGAKGL